MEENYINYVLTDAGQALLSRIIAGTVVTFKRLAVGDGFLYNQDAYYTRTELINEILSIDDISMNIDNEDHVTLKGKFNTSQLTQSFWYREIGIYAVDPDNEANEILFAYGNHNDSAEYITPHVNNRKIEKSFECTISVGQSANVRIYVNDNNALSVLDFSASEWVYKEALDIYVLDSGQYNRVGVNVFKKTELGRVTVEFVDIITNDNESLKLHALEPFDGYLIFA